MKLGQHIRLLSDKLDRNKQRQRKLADKFARLQRGGSFRVAYLFDWAAFDERTSKKGRKGKGGKLLPSSRRSFSRSSRRQRLLLAARTALVWNQGKPVQRI